MLACVALGATSLSAWTAPGSTPPNGNVSAPVNIGTTDQVKNGGLSVNTLLVSGNAAIYRSGVTTKLGINKQNPLVPLDVNGTIKVGNTNELCQAVSEGAIRYNTSLKQIEFCDGIDWRGFMAYSTCYFNGSVVANGASVTAYQSPSVPYGSSCASQQRTCTNGSLSGSYSYATCSVAPGANCNLNGTVVPHGSSIAAYGVSYTWCMPTTVRCPARTSTRHAHRLTSGVTKQMTMKTFFSLDTLSVARTLGVALAAIFCAVALGYALVYVLNDSSVVAERPLSDSEKLNILGALHEESGDVPSAETRRSVMEGLREESVPPPSEEERLNVLRALTPNDL